MLMLFCRVVWDVPRLAGSCVGHRLLSYSIEERTCVERERRTCACCMGKCMVVRAPLALLAGAAVRRGISGTSEQT